MNIAVRSIWPHCAGAPACCRNAAMTFPQTHYLYSQRFSEAPECSRMAAPGRAAQLLMRWMH